jgi:uncharacterized protein (TIGR00369 family)
MTVQADSGVTPWRRCTANPEVISWLHRGTSPDRPRAEMPVDEHHVRPFSSMHSGASVVLAETLGSVFATLASPEGRSVVGVEKNANHLAAVRGGDRMKVPGRPLQMGAASTSGKSRSVAATAGWSASRASPRPSKRAASGLACPYLSQAARSGAPNLRSARWPHPIRC